jgi:hypothetical protein
MHTNCKHTYCVTARHEASNPTVALVRELDPAPIQVVRPYLLKFLVLRAVKRVFYDCLNKNLPSYYSVRGSWWNCRVIIRWGALGEIAGLLFAEELWWNCRVVIRWGALGEIGVKLSEIWVNWGETVVKLSEIWVNWGETVVKLSETVVKLWWNWVKFGWTWGEFLEKFGWSLGQIGVTLG